eukprot:GHVT01068114.1.p1 GENE.GHVT01068114.1~~GHVT01068114.1.p1  ORF type:complete len:486 (-),score=65.58 GHVT01068114.1:248-1705(-)
MLGGLCLRGKAAALLLIVLAGYPSAVQALRNPTEELHLALYDAATHGPIDATGPPSAVNLGKIEAVDKHLTDKQTFYIKACANLQMVAAHEHVMEAFKPSEQCNESTAEEVFALSWKNFFIQRHILQLDRKSVTGILKNHETRLFELDDEADRIYADVYKQLLQEHQPSADLERLARGISYGIAAPVKCTEHAMDTLKLACELFPSFKIPLEYNGKKWAEAVQLQRLKDSIAAGIEKQLQFTPGTDLASMQKGLHTASLFYALGSLEGAADNLLGNELVKQGLTLHQSLTTTNSNAIAKPSAVPSSCWEFAVHQTQIPEKLLSSKEVLEHWRKILKNHKAAEHISTFELEGRLANPDPEVFYFVMKIGGLREYITKFIDPNWEEKANEQEDMIYLFRDLHDCAERYRKETKKLAQGPMNLLTYQQIQIFGADLIRMQRFFYDLYPMTSSSSLSNFLHNKYGLLDEAQISGDLKRLFRKCARKRQA